MLDLLKEELEMTIRHLFYQAVDNYLGLYITTKSSTNMWNRYQPPHCCNPRFTTTILYHCILIQSVLSSIHPHFLTVGLTPAQLVQPSCQVIVVVIVVVITTATTRTTTRGFVKNEKEFLLFQGFVFIIFGRHSHNSQDACGD